MSIKTLIVPVIGLCVAASPAPAFTQLAPDQHTRIVPIKPGELMSAAGRAAIDRRIKHAAEVLCGINDGRLALLGQAFDQCRDLAIADARRRLAVRVAAATGQSQLASITTDAAEDVAR